MAMKTKTVLLCESCETPILKREDGFVLHGALFPADTNAEPLAGAALPNKPTVQTRDVPVTAFCKPCFASKLGLFIAQPMSLPHAHIQGARGGAIEVPAGPQVLTDNGPVIDLTHKGTPVVAPNGSAVGAVAHAGSVLPKGNVSTMPALPGPIQVGDIVRASQRHRFFAQLKGRAARVERFREDSRDFVLALGTGQPMIARAEELEKIG